MAALSASSQHMRQRFLESWEPLRQSPLFPSDAEHLQILRSFACQHDEMNCGTREVAAGSAGVEQPELYDSGTAHVAPSNQPAKEAQQ